VPVLLNPVVEYRLGGAGAVAAMCAALGAHVTLCGLIGEDPAGEKVLELLARSDVSEQLVCSKARPTTAKERLCGVASGRHRQQLLRTDIEDVTPLQLDLQAELIERIQDSLRRVPDIILVSDYAKGVCSPKSIEVLQSEMDRVIVDPPKDFFVAGDDRYCYASCLVPNRHEAGGHSATTLAARFHTDAAIVKLDEEGCDLAFSDWRGGGTQELHITSRARSVYDVTGAGDQFLAVLGCARATGAGWEDATELANFAAGLQVERHGCVPVSLADLQATGR
jgi:D-beta-D-heptose 7-phosphate kinase/D-beta-D-heptose 1-phosphate adenosyltransferase